MYDIQHRSIRRDANGKIIKIVFTNEGPEVSAQHLSLSDDTQFVVHGLKVCF